MSTTQEPTRNHLLAALPLDARRRVFSRLALTRLPLGAVVYEAGQNESHVYFPIDSIVSLLNVMADGASAEISLVGNEGIVGTAVFMGSDSSPSSAVVVSGGSAFSLPADELQTEFNNYPEVRIVMLRYTQVLITQMSQMVVCNRHHSIFQQLCRWLLLSLDRLPDNCMTMTHELIANMLGVRREGVTEAACKLQRIGAIEYHRGHITVLDRPLIEKLSCACYEMVKNETDRLQLYPSLRVLRPLSPRRRPEQEQEKRQYAVNYR